jgi:chromate transporter
MTDLTSPAPAPAPRTLRLSHRELFLGFLSAGLRGFGGVMPWARAMIIEERRWLTEAEFTELYSLCNLLPGPNIVNLSMVLGARCQGISGAIAAFTGLMLMPLVIVITLGWFYERYQLVPALGPVLHNVAAVAAGLVIAAGAKMGRPFITRPPAIAVAIIGFVAVGVLHWPLIWVVLALLPTSLALHLRGKR